MVDSIIAGSPQQIPASKAFQPGQAPKNPLNTPKINEAPQAIQTQNTSVSAGKEEEINQKLALSRDNTRPNSSQISSSVNRGSALDISV